MQSTNQSAVASTSQQPAHIAYARRQLVLPTWQPDSEVSHCFVCNSPFTLFFRKHHCRRCGRVVCRSCSPHRITMPRQYIVQPPHLATSSDEEDLLEVTAFGHGFTASEEVRVCNPCVPDPNPNPPSSPHPPAYIERAIPTSFGARLTSSDLDRSSSPVGEAGPMRNLHPRPAGHRISYSVTDIPSSVQREAASRMGRDYGVGSAGRAQGNNRFPPFAPLYDAQPGAYRGSMIPSNLSTFQPNSYDSMAPLARTMRPVGRSIAEEDECPVCGEELPQRQVDDDESSRKAHIEACLQFHMYSSSAPPESTGRPSTPTASPDPGVAVPESITERPQEFLAQEGSRGQSRRMTRGQMLVYLATEKDCTGGDSVVQECVICLEDFEVRQEMARLECLCKFHRKCIRDWWNTKGVGSCPTHQLHT